MYPSERSGGAGHVVDRQGRTRHLALYKFDSCPYCVRVYRTLDALGVDVEYRDIHADDEHRRTLLERGGKVQVPCLFVDGEPMYESQDIAHWLDAEFGRPR